jgi:hypothetical protein
MSIFYFEIQRLNENRKNLKNWGLFAVCMHTAKEPTWRAPVHSGAGMLRAGKVFAVRDGRRRTANVQVRCTAKKFGTAKVARMAKKCGTATGKTHGARQRCKAHGKGC